jgi:hypothetical protein
MRPQLIGTGIILLLTASGCATTYDAEPEPEAPPLHIEDQSTDAPPPAPPSAAPPDAEVAPSTGVSSAPPAPPANVAAAPAPSAPPSSPPNAPPPSAAPAQDAPPNSAQWAYEYPTGRWVYANGYGWMWVPASAATVDSDGVPYTYLYTPTYGWTWYVSPWGPGPYRYGVWVRRPWHPVGWHGAWVAHPGVVVRLGGPSRHYYGHGRGRRGR